MVLRGIFEPESNEVTGGWRELQNVEFIRTIKSRRLRWTNHVSSMGEKRKKHKVLAGASLARCNCRCQDNIVTSMSDYRRGLDL
jgi:hypothetical protein